jgi:hypothetical protein
MTRRQRERISRHAAFAALAPTSLKGIQRMTTDDDAMGMAWWNNLTPKERREWMRRAGDTGRAVDAWEAFKKGDADLPRCRPMGQS